MWQCNGIVYYVTKRLSCWLPFFLSLFNIWRRQKSNHCLIELKLCEMCLLYRLILHTVWCGCELSLAVSESRLFYFLCVTLSLLFLFRVVVFFFLFCFVSSLCVSLWTTRTLVTHISITDRVQYISRPKSGSHLLTNYRRSSSFRLSLFFFFILFF